MLAFDFGTRRIGVAVGDLATRLAHPLATIERERESDRFSAIAALVDEWKPDRLVVGIPLHADGAPHEMTARAQRFGRQLAARTALPVEYADERHTTLAAASSLAEAGRTGKRARDVRDRVAAQLILQAWLDEQPR
ncbi:MAG: Holliday junction resolvase RuvX [Betaproteobacteria bacterium]